MRFWPMKCPLHFGREGMGSVFDDDQVVTGGDGIDGVQVGRQAGDVDRDDGPGALGNSGLDQVRIEVKVSGANIDKHRLCLKVAHGFGRGCKGVGAGDHLVAPLRANRFQGQVHGRRAEVDGDGVFGPKGSRKLSLELASLGAGGDPTRSQGVHHLI